MANIREATVDDIPQLARIHVLCWQDTYKGVVSDTYLDSMDPIKNQERWQRILNPPKNPVRAIEVDGELVGFFSWGPSRIEALPYQQELYSLYILSAYRSRGIGQQVIQYVKAQVNTTILVGVLEGNPYISFYEKLGKLCNYNETVELGDAEHIEMYFEL